MNAQEILLDLKQKFGAAIPRADVPSEEPVVRVCRTGSLKVICRYFFRELDARYIAGIGSDDRPFRAISWWLIISRWIKTICSAPC